MARRITVRSARESLASSFGSPPVIMVRAAISISPSKSRFSSSSGLFVPVASASRSSSIRSSATTLARFASGSNNESAPANGGRLTSAPGAMVTLCTDRPWARRYSHAKVKLLPASIRKIRGRHTAKACISRYTTVADFPAPGGPTISR